MNTRILSLALTLCALVATGCYGHGGPTAGYTFNRGFSGGVDGGAGMLFVGGRGGAVWRGEADGEGTEALGYAGLEAGLLGTNNLGLGMSFGEPGVGFLASLDSAPGFFFKGESPGPDRARSSRTVAPLAFEVTDSVILTTYFGARYIGGEFELYISPQLYTVDTGGVH